MTCPFPQDLDRCVTVFKAQKDDTDQPWVYVGKQRAHYKTIHGKKDSSNPLAKNKIYQQRLQRFQYPPNFIL